MLHVSLRQDMSVGVNELTTLVSNSAKEIFQRGRKQNNKMVKFQYRNVVSENNQISLFHINKRSLCRCNDNSKASTNGTTKQCLFMFTYQYSNMSLPATFITLLWFLLLLMNIRKFN